MKLKMLLREKDISVHSKIVSVFNTVDKDGNKISEKHTSTAGRFFIIRNFTKKS